MKYMTKEWYETMQKTDIHLLLKVSKKAETYSEDYFRELYRREEKKWLKLQKEVSEVKFEDIFPEEFYDELVEGHPLKVVYLEQREQARIKFDNRPMFNPEQERKAFKQSLRRNINVLKKKLPESILQKVADIRALALNVASCEVKQEITRYCKQNEKSVNLAMDAYQKQYRRQFKSNAPSFAEELNLHDCKVLSCRKKERYCADH